MNKLVLLLIIFFLSSCAQIRFCDYPLTEKGWIATDKPSLDLLDKHNSDDKWFTNRNGDYIACPEMKGKNHCGNVYQIYKRLENKEYDEHTILCLT